MKTITTVSIMTILNVHFKFLPSIDLLVAMGISIVLDFITGVAKAVVNHEARTSEGYRKTVIKFIQYGGAVAVGVGLTYISQRDASFIQFSHYLDYLNNGLLIFIIFIEATSIFENMAAMDNTSKFATYFIKPILIIMTVKLKKNPLMEEAEKEEQDLDKTNTAVAPKI